MRRLAKQSREDSYASNRGYQRVEERRSARLSSRRGAPAVVFREHTSDIRHALGLGAIDHGAALVAALDRYLDVTHNALVASKAGAAVVTAGASSMPLGAHDDDAEVVATPTREPYEPFRVVGGRRSESQVRGLDWTGHVDAVVACVSAYAFASNDITGDAA